MDTSDWIAVAAVVVAVVAAGISAYAIKYARQSAVHAGASVVEARRSADEAARLREIEADRRSEEKQRRHEELGPNLPAEIEAVLGARTFAGGGGALYGEIQVDRMYRVQAFGRVGPSLTQLMFPSVTPAHGSVRFVIEPWVQGRVEPSVEEIVFKFWPPVEGVDRGEVWSCRCGQATGETLDGPGHWERRVKVNYYRPQDSVF